MIWLAGISCAVCIAAMAAIVLFDMTIRIIPCGLCWLLAGSGLALQAGMHGAGGVAAGACWAIVLYACTRIAAHAVNRRLGSEGAAIGGGDMRCMAALSLATGPYAPCGFAVCFGVAALWAAVARMRKRLLPGEPFAFAPFLALWFAAGVLAAT